MIVLRGDDRSYPLGQNEELTSSGRFEDSSYKNGYRGVFLRAETRAVIGIVA